MLCTLLPAVCQGFGNAPQYSYLKCTGSAQDTMVMTKYVPFKYNPTNASLNFNLELDSPDQPEMMFTEKPPSTPLVYLNIACSKTRISLIALYEYNWHIYLYFAV